MDLESYDSTQVEDWQALRTSAIKYKARLGMERKAAKGILHGCAPLGYKNAVVKGEKVIVIDPETVPKVKELFRMSRKKGITIRKLVPLAAEMGLKSRNGKPLGASSIHAILRNPFYDGMLKKKGEILLGKHDALFGGNWIV